MLIGIMWQVKIPFKSESEKETIISKSSPFVVQGIWEKENELIVYFDDERTMNDFLKSISDKKALFEKVAEKIEWLSRWKRFHKVVKVKPFLIIPSFMKGVKLDPPYKKKVTITPSFAFGTGSHPTTRMCVKYLVKTVKKGMKILDMGTGSGILAICAEKLGASHISGVEIDDIALKEAEKNIKRNRCNRIALSTKLNRKTDRMFDLCVCNILCEDILKLKADFDRVLKRGKGLILSGLLADQKELIMRKFSDNYRLLSEMKMKDKNFEWLALHLEKL
jgi:ribosomal protein L11 methyltransferase